MQISANSIHIFLISGSIHITFRFLPFIHTKLPYEPQDRQSVQFLLFPHLSISDVNPNTQKFSPITVIHYISYRNYYSAAGGVWSGATRGCSERVQLVVYEVVQREGAAGYVWSGATRGCSWLCVKWCSERVQLVMCEVKHSVCAAGDIWSGAARGCSWWCVTWSRQCVQLVIYEVKQREGAAGDVWRGVVRG